MSASSGGGRSLRRAAYLGDISALAALPPWCSDADAHASGGLLAGTAQLRACLREKRVA
jgi:hypothetical protein